jgi:hypothetical protein
VSTDRQRWVAFALCALSLAGIVAGLLAVGKGSWPEDEPPPAAAPARPVVIGNGEDAPTSRDASAATDEPSSDADATAPTTPAETAHIERAVVASARTFLRAQLRWEAGDGSAAVRGAIRASATPEFARFVLGERPRSPRGAERQPRGRIRAIGLEDGDGSLRNPDSGAISVEAVVVYRRPFSVYMTVVPRNGEWRVAGLP